jgi:predicted ester cyclase
MTEDDFKDFFKHRQDAFDRHDVIALCADYTTDVVVESQLFGRTVGRNANEKLFERLFLAFPDFSVQGQELLVFGDRVLQTVMVSGTDTGGFHGLAPTGRPFHVLCLFVFTFGEQLIMHERRIYDSSGLLLQLAGQAPGCDLHHLRQDEMDI